MRRENSWLILVVFLVYPASYVALRLSDVLTRPNYWSCLGPSTTPRVVTGPAPLAVVYQPLIRVEAALRP